jgi:membrane protein involved in colicin uptake
VRGGGRLCLYDGFSGGYRECTAFSDGRCRAFGAVCGFGDLAARDWEWRRDRALTRGPDAPPAERRSVAEKARRAEEDTKRHAVAEKARRTEEEAKRRADKEAKRPADEDAEADAKRREAEEEAKRRAEEAAKRHADEAAKRREAEQRRRAEDRSVHDR